MMADCCITRVRRYVFDRLDTLMSSLVRHYVGAIESINGLGVEKLCRNVFGLKQNFTNITLKPRYALAPCIVLRQVLESVFFGVLFQELW
jgi:hypothetical protein